MSDFFEMRAVLEEKMAIEVADRRMHGRFYQAMMVMIVGATLGIVSGIHQVEQPVGGVSKDFCKTSCKTVVIVFNK